MKKIRPQLILNLTPNSFSDGGANNSEALLNESMFWAKKFGICDFDFGAESTAPMNESISFEEEMSRFQTTLFPFFKKNTSQVYFNKETTTFSIDTYRYLTFKQVKNFIKEDFNKVHIIWNDVSGVIDNDVLEHVKEGPYILCHNLAGKRELAGKHHLFMVDKNTDIIESVAQFFSERLELIPNEYHKNIILDPCFGFSKDNEQNLELLNRLEELMVKFKGLSWLIGISRKRFIQHQILLESKNLTKDELNNKCDLWQLKYFSKLLTSLDSKIYKELYLRMHDGLCAKEINNRQSEMRE